MSNKQSPPPQPPEPPQVDRQFKLYPYQWISIPLILLIPVLALFGVFGDRLSEITQSTDGLNLKVNYATHFRYKTMNPLTISIQNTSSQVIDRLVIDVGREYIQNFNQIKFEPNVTQITDQFYEFAFESVAAGETRVVTIDLQGERPGQHKGSVIASAGADNTAQVSIETFVFP